jgi:hypothetical protein
MVGLVTTQGDEAMRADVARQRFGVDGTDISIGVISSSFNLLGTAADDVATGDLPANVNILFEPPPESADLFGPGIDEGRGMMQLIHDVAPGANLLFHGFLGEGNSPFELERASVQVFADGIQVKAAAGADIIVDDVGFFTEPFFQDGIIAQAINEVVAQGVLYFSAAGNSGRNSYESAFNLSGEFDPRFNGELHDFDPGAGIDTLQSITIPVGSSFASSFQWDSPFSSLNANSGGSPNDLDIFLLDSSGNIVANSTESNIGGDPVEFLQFLNDGSYGSDQFNVAITLREGAAPSLLKYVDFANEGTIDQLILLFNDSCIESSV